MVHEMEEYARFKAELLEVQRKIDRVEKLTDKCDPRMLDAITDINIFVEKNKKFSASREWRMVVTDVNTIKTDIMDHCICPRRR